MDAATPMRPSRPRQACPSSVSNTKASANKRRIKVDKANPGTLKRPTLKDKILLLAPKLKTPKAPPVAFLQDYVSKRMVEGVCKVLVYLFGSDTQRAIQIAGSALGLTIEVSKVRGGCVK
jgi:hypothetical protein